MVSAKDIPPGGVGEVKATFKSKGYQGKVTKNITIETNDPANRMVRLTLKGEVVPDVTVEPRQVNFAKVNRNQPPQPVKLEIKLREGKKLKVKEVTTESKFIVLNKVEENDKGAVYTVGLGDKPSTGRLFGNIVIKTNSKKSPEIQVPFYGTVEGDVRVTPQFISFAAVAPGDQATREINVARTGRNTFTVKEVTASSDRIETKVSPVREGEEYRVAVTYHAAPDASGRISDKLKIVVRNGEEETLEVPVYGTVFKKKEPSQLQ